MNKKKMEYTHKNHNNNNNNNTIDHTDKQWVNEIKLFSPFTSVHMHELHEYVYMSRIDIDAPYELTRENSIKSF